MTSEEATAGESKTRVIKRYSNRKLYDTTDSRYVTLNQIGEMVRRGEEVQIIDNKTKEDKTEVTLALIISEELKNKPRSVSVSTLRNLIQERGERMLSTLRETPLGRLIKTEGEEGDGVGEGEVAEGEVAEGEVAEGEVAEGEVAEGAAGGSETPAAEASPAKDDKDERSAKARLNELVESSRQRLDELQATLDDRVAAVVPGIGLIRELRDQVSQLASRIDAIETHLGIDSKPPTEPSDD